MDGRRTEGFRLYLEADLVGNDTPNHLYEATAGWMFSDALHVRAGLVPVPLGSEAAARPEDLVVPGRSFTSFLTMRTDLGAQAEGRIAGDVAKWQATVGTGHGFGLDGRTRSAPLAALRATARPLPWLRLGAGAERLFDFGDPVVQEVPLGDAVFLTPDLDGDGGRFLLGEIGVKAGPFDGSFEIVRGATFGGADRFDELTAWTATGSVDLGRGWNVGLRCSNADTDRDLFRAGWTTYDPSTQEVRTFSAMLAWKPGDHLRISAGWVKTIADDSLTVFGGGPPTTVPRAPGGNRDSSFVFRIELSF